MNFDLRLNTEDITLTDKDGNDKEFVMYEATGTQRDMQMKYVEKRQDKVTKEVDMLTVKEHFLGMLLRYKDANTPVGTEFFIGMPAQIRDRLFEVAQEISGMKTEAELIKLLMDREMQKMLEKQEAEDAGEEYVDQDVEEAKKLAEEEASGKE